MLANTEDVLGVELVRDPLPLIEFFIAEIN
jgi:hypothetical protein